MPKKKNTSGGKNESQEKLQAPKETWLVRLELRLPADHPVFQIPQGSRAAAAREWLDTGARLAAIEKKLEALAVLERKLRTIEEKLANGAVLAQVPGKEDNKVQAPSFDVMEFIKKFE